MPEEVRSLRQNANSVAARVCPGAVPALASDFARQSGLWEGQRYRWTAGRRTFLTQIKEGLPVNWQPLSAQMDYFRIADRHKPFLFRSTIRVAKRRLAIQDLVSSR